MDSLFSNIDTSEVENSFQNGDCPGDELRAIESCQETNGTKFLSPSKELQEAKRKLEELRLLRFEEKSFLKQEIEQLTERFGEGEKNSSNLEKQLKKCNIDNAALRGKMTGYEKEIAIGAKINSMQEEEITRLEKKLKDEELQRYDVSKQLELVRKAILEKEQIRMSELAQMISMKERIAELDEASSYYKSTTEEGEKAIWDMEQINHSLNEKVSSLTAQLDEAMSKVGQLSQVVADSEAKLVQSEEKESNAQTLLLECQVNFESQVTKCETLQEEHAKQVEALQQEIETVTFNERKYKDKCEQTEHLFHETRREKEQEMFELQRIVDRVPMLEDQIQGLERKNSETEVLLGELRDVVGRHVRKQKAEESGDANISQSSSIQLSPTKSSSPGRKGKGEDCVTPREIEEYFKEADENMHSLHEQIVTLSQQVEHEKSMMTELGDSMRNELEKAQTSLIKINEQYEQANETIKLHEQNNESKAKENEHLRELIKDCEGQIDRLKTELLSTYAGIQKTKETMEKANLEMDARFDRQNEEAELLRQTIQDYEGQVERLKADNEEQVERLNADVSALRSEISQNTAAHLEEQNRLQLTVQGLESDIQNVQGDKKNEEQKFVDEALSLKEIIECRNEEISGLQSEIKTLAEDNEILGQRLKHLESYSVKLGEMLENNQSADEKTRGKFLNEIKEYKQIISDKDAEIIELTRKMDELGQSVQEKCDYQDRIDQKVNGLAATLEKLEKENERIRKEKEELRTKLESVSDSSASASNNEEKANLEKTRSEQQALIEELHDRMRQLETENNSLKKTVSTMGHDIRLKESLIAELSRKTGETVDSISSLKSSVQKAESEKRHYQNQLNVSRHEKQMLDKTIREHENEKNYFLAQVSNLQSLLAKAEDAKEASLSSMAHYQSQLETLRTIKEEEKLQDLEGEIQSLRAELSEESQRRDRLEAHYAKRDEQVSKLRSTFDQSLSTISKETKNIENVLGKSLQKIGKMENSETDLVDSDSESLEVSAKVSIDKKYLSLPPRRNKSLESSLGELKLASLSSSTPPRKSPKYVATKSSPNSSPKRIPTRPSPAKTQSYIHEVPVRDEVANYNRDKRLSR